MGISIQLREGISKKMKKETDLKVKMLNNLF